MGRVGRPRLRSARWLPLFAFLLLAPAAGFCFLGWRSLQHEHEARVKRITEEAKASVRARAKSIEREMEQIRATEEQRHFYEWQDEYCIPNVVSTPLAFQTTPLSGMPKSDNVAGWFQWELYPNGQVFGTPEYFPRADSLLTTSVESMEVSDQVVGMLRKRLYDAPTNNRLSKKNAREVEYPQQLILANEERGKIQEEFALMRQSDRTSRVVPQSANGENVEDATMTPYLRDFVDRVDEARTIRVLYTSFHYSALPRAAAPLDLLVWRLVRIPAQDTHIRAVQHDRYLIQGYVLSLAEAVPHEWEDIGNTQVTTLLWTQGNLPQGSFGHSVVEELPPMLVDDETTSNINGHLVMTLIGRPNPKILRSTREKSLNRFLLLAAGLLGVVGVGFYALARGLRRERALVQRKEDFIAAVTHELKTPLTGIRMYADMLKEGWVASPEMATEYADRILEESMRLGQLVNQVLDLAALERGVATLHAQPGDLGPVVVAAAELMQSRADEAGADLRVQVAEGLPLVLMDPQLIRPLVLNLIDNAVKYGKRGDEHRIDVSLRRERESVVLRIADRGPGMTAATQKTLFIPFHRSGSAMKRGAPGVGIGLALTKRYVDAHHAKIRVRSTRGEGTTIIVTFPIHDATGRGASGRQSNGKRNDPQEDLPASTRSQDDETDPTRP